MNIVKFIKDQTKIWNERNSCGFCWAFGGAIEQSQINVYEIRSGEECCVHVFITDIQFVETELRNAQTGLVNEKKCQWKFNLWVGVPKALGNNFVEETQGYPIEEGLWESTIQPLMDCLSCGKIIDACEILGHEIKIPTWIVRPIFYKFTSNYTGILINGTFEYEN